MAKIDLDSLGIEELAGLRENATDKLFEKVAAPRRARSGAGKAGPVRQAGEEGGKRASAEGEEDRRSQRAEGIGCEGRMIRPRNKAA